MNVEATLLNKLKAEQARFALEALQRPNQRDAFEYGYRAGTLAGLESAVSILLKLFDEEKNGDRDL